MYRSLLLLALIGCAKDDTDETDTGPTNLPPTAPVVAIEPAEPLAGQPMHAVILEEATDPEGAPLTYRYEWLVNDAASSARGDTVEGAAVLTGDEWKLEVFANDGELDGEPGTAEVTVINGPPSMTPEILPDPAYTDDVLTCVPHDYDPEEDPYTLTYTWRINGTDAGTDPTLDPSLFVKGDTIECFVQSYQNDAASTAATATAVIQNSPPSGASTETIPEQPTMGDDIVCLGLGATDADGDEISWTFEWTADGPAYAGPTSSTNWPGDTIPAAEAVKAMNWQCRAVPSDGEDEGRAKTLDIFYAVSLELGTCGATGPDGPTQEQCDAAYAGTQVSVTVSSSYPGIQRWTTPGPGLYQFDLYGAQGGGPGGGGPGAWVSGVVFYDVGTPLDFVVGQAGGGGATDASGGGGGGSWFFDNAGDFVVIAGGGGGTGAGAGQPGCGGTDNKYAVLGSGDATTSACEIKAEGLYFGGDVTAEGYGAGGGGYTGSGSDDLYGSGGKSWYSSPGVTGGSSDASCGEVPTGDGGFGGGGAGGCSGGGGGGGYSGGDGGLVAGGGGSANVGARADSESGVRYGDGRVVITRLPE